MLRTTSILRLMLSSRLSLEMKTRSDHHEYFGLLTWLSPANYESRLRENVKSRLQGTARWFLEHTLYLNWVSGSTSTLFCPGDFGTGKSVISATVADDLRQTLGNATQPVIYLYCDWSTQSTQSTQSVENFLGDVVRQLVHARGWAPRSMYDMQRKYEAAGSRPSLDEWEQTVKDLLSDCKQAFIVVDALDECDEEVCKVLLSLIQRLQNLHTVKLLATSRPIFTVQELFCDKAEIVIRASEHDVRIYACSRIADFRSRVNKDSDFAGGIVNAVVSSANGV